NNQDNKQKLDSETLELNKNTQNNIFISEGFDLWKRLYNEFDIDNSRTFRVDLRFLYEKMKDDGLISEFITITNFIDWLNTNHPRDKAITKLDYTDIKASSNSKRLKDYDKVTKQSEQHGQKTA